MLDYAERAEAKEAKEGYALEKKKREGYVLRKDERYFGDGHGEGYSALL